MCKFCMTICLLHQHFQFWLYRIWFQTCMITQLVVLIAWWASWRLTLLSSSSLGYLHCSCLPTSFNPVGMKKLWFLKLKLAKVCEASHQPSCYTEGWEYVDLCASRMVHCVGMEADLPLLLITFLMHSKCAVCKLHESRIVIYVWERNFEVFIN